MKEAIMAEIFDWQAPEEGMYEGRVIEAARSMALSDLDAMEGYEFLERTPSEMAFELIDVIGTTMQEQVQEILSMKGMEEELQSLGIESEQESIPYKRVIEAVHSNYMRGVTILGYYLSIVDHVKERLDGQD